MYLNIIILPAVILIPIAKIIAVVIGGLSLPSLAVGKFLKTKWYFVVLLLISLAVLIAVGLKIYNPDRPWF